MRLSTVVISNISNVLQKIFADRAFGPTTCRRFSAVFVQDDVSYYWFAQTLSLFDVTVHEPGSKKGEIAFIQYFDVTSLADEIGEELNSVDLRWAMDSGLHHSVNFKIVDSKTIGECEWYGLISFLSVLSAHHIVKSTYFVPSFYLQLPRPPQRYYIACFCQFRR